MQCCGYLKLLLAHSEAQKFLTALIHPGTNCLLDGGKKKSNQTYLSVSSQIPCSSLSFSSPYGTGREGRQCSSRRAEHKGDGWHVDLQNETGKLRPGLAGLVALAPAMQVACTLACLKSPAMIPYGLPSFP